MNSCTPEGFVVPAPLVAPVMVLFNNTRSCKTKDRQCNGQKKKGERIYKTLHRKLMSNMNPTKHGDEFRCSGKVRRSWFTSGTCVTVKQHEHYLIWQSCWTPIYVNKYKKTNKTWTPATKQMELRTNQTTFLCGNRSRHHNADVETWRHFVRQHKQHKLYWKLVTINQILTKNRPFLF